MNESNETSVSRRRFLVKSSAAALAAGIAAQPANSNVFAQNNDKNKPPTAGTQKPIKLPPFTADTERKTEPPMPIEPENRVGFALLGLGRLSVEQLLPAFAQCKKAKAVALVSGAPEKARQLAAQYGIAEKNIYDYKTYDRLRDNAEVKAIFEIGHFAECILENKQPFSPGEEGLQDHRIMEKICEAARTGKTVKLASEIKNAKIPRGAEPKT